MFVEFPEDISLRILSTLLELKSVNLLDTSFCNSKVRNYVLDLYRSPLLTFKGEHSETRNCIVRYIGLRGLKLSELVVDSASFEVIFENNIDTSKVTSICESADYTTEGSAVHWIELINSCPKLTNLEMCGGSWLGESVLLQQVDVRILQQLKVLKIRQLSKDGSVSLLAVVCHKLVDCELCLNEEHAKILFENNRNIENV